VAKPRLKYFGWGREGEGLTSEEAAFVLARDQERFGVREFEHVAPPPEDAIELPKPRLQAPGRIAGICTSDRYDRLAHTYGKAYPDAVRGLAGDYGAAPDIVAYPRRERDIEALLEFAADARAAVIPFGGGSSVCGGTEARDTGPTITVDMRYFDEVVEIDETSRAARIQGGVFGPDIEAILKPRGLTLRHFPQSFEYSTLGGWIATRSGGHFATQFTHIDDFVESLRVVTPNGTLETRRLPGSGAGPSPDRMFIGSEGILGFITEAWMRLQPRPRFRAGGALGFPSFYAAARAVRAILQAGLYPANCRILDPQEAYNTGAADGSVAIMVLGFEGGDHPLDARMVRALECARDHGGEPEPDGSHRSGAAELWRTAFIRMPYAREQSVQRAVISDTFETAITWDKFENLHAHVIAATERAIEAATGRRGQVTCRFTHAYPDGPAPYFSFHALGRHGALLDQWQTIKSAAGDALLEAGGTITHHHAVGRDHRPWYDKQRPDIFADALRAAKRALDPYCLLNPGMLVDM
jgi:alkyldihydroxyacetonephosphate synthase